MLTEAGAIIGGEPDGGIADAGAIDANNGGNLGGTKTGEIFTGNAEDGETERIERPVRTTKNGRPDGRSLRRGRRSSAVGTSETKTTVDLGSFTFNDLLVGAHAMLAGITKIQELEIDDAEGKKLGDAIQNVLKQYDHQINPKVAAWVNLSMVSMAIYGPRYMAMRISKHSAKLVEMPAPTAATEPDPPQPLERDASIQ